jgi:hypothetical protein
MPYHRDSACIDVRGKLCVCQQAVQHTRHLLRTVGGVQRPGRVHIAKGRARMTGQDGDISGPRQLFRQPDLVPPEAAIAMRQQRHRMDTGGNGAIADHGHANKDRIVRKQAGGGGTAGRIEDHGLDPGQIKRASPDGKWPVAGRNGARPSKDGKYQGESFHEGSPRTMNASVLPEHP